MVGETRSYNGDIGRLTAIQKEHDKRITKLEESFSDDHDKITIMEARIGMVESTLEKHLGWHEEMDKSLRSLKISLIVLIVQIAINWLILYYMGFRMI